MQTDQETDPGLEVYSHFTKKKVVGPRSGILKGRNTAEECRAINRKPHRHLQRKPEEQLRVKELLARDLFKRRFGMRKE